ncbi:MAG: zinc ribbon domain-containing protein [Planctomycetota bacterium]|jgi:Zn ribbon nucleic-acid-binding protein
MPAIRCPQCRKEEEVSLEVMGNIVECPACGHVYKARALRQITRARGQKNPLKALFWVLGIGLLMVAVLILQTLFRSGTTPDSTRDRQGEAVEAEPSFTSPDEESKKDSMLKERTAREAFCLDFLEALANQDAEAAMKMLNFPVFYRNQKSPSEPRWNDLSELDQVMKKQETIQAMTQPLSEKIWFAELLDSAEIDELDLEAETSMAAYRIRIEDPIDGKKYGIEMKLKEMGRTIYVCGFSLDISKPSSAADPDKPRTLDEKYKRRISPEGEIREVAYTTDSSSADIRELTALLDKFLTGTRAERREVREKLDRFGVKAIPALLNRLVDLDMTIEEDIGRANTILGVLRGMTKEHFGFTPGYRVDDVFDDPAEELRRSLRRWFGWWEKNKQTWKGPAKVVEDLEAW